jgi:hypothetical protein
MMMLSLMLTLLFVNDNIDDANDADDADDVDDVNNADVDNADDKRRRRSSIEERKESRLDTSLDRAERLVTCCSSAPLAVSQAESNNKKENFFKIQRLKLEKKRSAAKILLLSIQKQKKIRCA